jgi:MFS family permease
MAFGHPKGLFPLFFTEMWERLAFYTMVGILLLYATDTERGGLGMPSAEGNEIYGLYLAFVYFTPFLGGIFADRFLGYRKAVAVGGILMGAGLLLMRVPGFTFFVVGLIGLILGNGFFKPNISAMVGNLYEPGDPKRDAGFNIFYMGINTGAFAATFFVAPWFRNVYGWGWTFRAAGFGVLFAVVILVSQWKLLSRADRQPERSADDVSVMSIAMKILFPAFLVGLAGYFVAEWLEMTVMRPSDFGFIVGMIPVLAFFVMLAVKAKPEEKPGLYALLPLFVAGGAFFEDRDDAESAQPAGGASQLLRQRGRGRPAPTSGHAAGGRGRQDRPHVRAAAHGRGGRAGRGGPGRHRRRRDRRRGRGPIRAMDSEGEQCLPQRRRIRRTDPRLARRTGPLRLHSRRGASLEARGLPARDQHGEDRGLPRRPAHIRRDLRRLP